VCLKSALESVFAFNSSNIKAVSETTGDVLNGIWTKTHLLRHCDVEYLAATPMKPVSEVHSTRMSSLATVADAAVTATTLPPATSTADDDDVEADEQPRSSPSRHEHVSSPSYPDHVKEAYVCLEFTG